MKKYIPALIFVIIAALFQILPVLATTTYSIDPSNLPSFSQNALTGILNGNGQILYANNGQVDILTNSYASTTNNNLMPNINFGYTGYANPNGMFNLYATSTSPVLSASFMGSTTQYTQIYGQNTNSSGSMDLVFASDLGTSTSTENYFDVGIANSTQIDPALPIILAKDAYVFNKTGRLIIGSGSLNASSTVLVSSTMSTTTYTRFDQYQHFITHGAKPVLSNCTGGSLSALSNSNSGTITITGVLSLTSCVVTWTATPYPTGSEVQCTVNSKNNATLGGYTSTLTSLTIPVTIGIGGGSFTYQCQASE